jgi:hypothetical protein
MRQRRVALTIADDAKVRIHSPPPPVATSFVSSHAVRQGQKTDQIGFVFAKLLIHLHIHGTPWNGITTLACVSVASNAANAFAVFTSRAARAKKLRAASRNAARAAPKSVMQITP